MNKKELSNIRDHSAPSGRLPVKYIIKSSIETINNTEVLLVSLFEQNQKKKKSDNKAGFGILKFKIFIWDDKYITQKLQEDGSYKWSRACISNLMGHWGPWSWSSKNLASCDMSSDKENISSFLKVKCVKVGDELKAIHEFQTKIMRKKLEEKHEAIKKKIDEVMDRVPSLPKNFETWIYDGPFEYSRYIYYKREGRNINAFCTGCKKDFVIQETKLTRKNVKHNNPGKCPSCNKKITYKAVGKTTNLIDSTNFAIIQKYDDNLIVRYFTGTKTYREHYKNPSISYRENIREIYSFNENTKLSVKRYEYAEFLQTGRVRWCDSSGRIQTQKSYLYTRNLKIALKGTKWQYSCIYDLAKKMKYVCIDTFLNEYIKHPAIEYLIKCKLYRFTDKNLSAYFSPDWSDINFKGKNLKEVLGIDKQLFQQMQRLDLDSVGLRLIKGSFTKGKVLTDDQVKWIISNVDIYSFMDMLDYSTPHKIIQYIKKQSNDNYKLDNVLIDWDDYIIQCRKLKFDIKNTFVLYPKNLKEKHEEYTIMIKSKNLKKHSQKVKDSFEKLNKIYSYSNKKFLIRPANSVDEIVREGQMLRHCVGGNHYVEGVAKGNRAIMLVRDIDNPNTPFYTLDLNLTNLRITQCRGYRNRDMTDEVKRFTEEWKAKKLTTNTRKKVV
ncbi:PcfJ domain-containing protein [Tepidibacter hydrothermalis]|uniref:PcfJ domain-containing protein n=1 Tax=Tepidibacter hydrothermalis TaxID=3036126 RepID=A0ABY8EGB5_9FIRM|nr:PcfJ domain-containing protein [Tepidibacter hydrothermalis]WFD11993.1 PcfJ domain-containing protein [Tepidibacter hydrothermalis]